ncbi:MAG: rod shape-determining protein MreD [Muribaculaceae bacterium]
MSKSIIQFIILFIVLVLVQAIICNHICIFNIAVPIIFIYFILRLPITLSVSWVLTLSFLLGLSVDIFSDTQGMNTLACTLLGVMRKPIFSLYFQREDDMSDPIPSIKSLGTGIFIKYLFTITVVYCTLIFFIQAFTFFDFQLTFFRIIGSSILTFVLLLGIDSLTNASREKRL